MNFAHYRKSIAAAVGALGAWWLAAFENGTVSPVEYGALIVAIGTVSAVWGVPNDPAEPAGE
jgi:hypothetical protein